MNKSLLVAQRELLENFTTKGFWIGILAFPLILTIFIVVPPWLEKTKDVRTYAVVDESGWLLTIVDRHITIKDLTRVFRGLASRTREKGADQWDINGDTRGVFGQLAQELVDLDETLIPAAAAFLVPGRENNGIEIGKENTLPASIKQTLEKQREAILSWWEKSSPREVGKLFPGVSRTKYHRIKIAGSNKNYKVLNRMVSDGELFAYFVIGPDPINRAEGSRYISKNLADDSLLLWFRSEVSDQVRSIRLKKEKIEPEVARWLIEPFPFDVRKIGIAGTEEKVKKADKILQMAPVAFVYFLLVSILTVGQRLMTNTIEEKSNRIIEVLLSSVSPLQLMAGKIMGIAGTGLTIVIAWMTTLFFATKYLPGLIKAQTSFDLSVIGTNPIYFLSFIVYFILGYFFYASILLAIGSICSTLKEAQHLLTPVMMILLIPFMSMIPITKDPNGTLALVLSYIPLFTPFAMMNRAATMPSLTEYVITTILMLVSIFGVLWMAAKIFRIGILLTGKPPGIREILKWIKAPVGSFPKQSGRP